MGPSLQRWLGSLRHLALGRVRAAQSRHLSSSSFCNTLPVARRGLRLLRQFDLRAVKADKENGYVLVPGAAIKQVHELILGSSSYEEVAADQEERFEDSVVRVAKKLADQVEVLEGIPGTSRSIMKSVSRCGSRLGGNLLLACKTHRPNGRVEFRNVHASPSYSLEGLGRWVSLVLEECLATSEFLLRDAPHLVEQLKGMKTDLHDVLVQVDARHFFMSGSAEELALDAASIIVDPGKRKLAQEIIFHLLSSRYLCSPELRDRLWLVRRGSGMGLVHSSSVADAAFAARMEKGLSARLPRAGVALYRRFRDDLLFVVSDRRLFWEFYREWEQQAG